MNGKCIYDGRRCACSYNSLCESRVRMRALHNFLAGFFFLSAMSLFVIACLGTADGRGSPILHVMTAVTIFANALVAHANWTAANRP